MKKQPTVVDVLKRMKALLRKGWTQKAEARTANGKEVPPESSTAVRFCLIGARERVLRTCKFDHIGMYEVRRLLEQCTNGMGVEAYNDAKNRKKSEVLAVVDCAIKAATK